MEPADAPGDREAEGAATGVSSKSGISLRELGGGLAGWIRAASVWRSAAFDAVWLLLSMLTCTKMHTAPQFLPPRICSLSRCSHAAYPTPPAMPRHFPLFLCPFFDLSLISTFLLPTPVAPTPDAAPSANRRANIPMAPSSSPLHVFHALHGEFPSPPGRNASPTRACRRAFAGITV
jgi:hypothetical protein